MWERPGLPTAMARAEAGQKIDDLLDAIAELQRMIDASPAETLEDAAVKLRRLEAYVDRGQHGYVDYIDQFGQRHRGGYARVYDPRLDTEPSRNNLLFITQKGYNYDRLRKRGEGSDW